MPGPDSNPDTRVPPSPTAADDRLEPARTEDEYSDLTHPPIRVRPEQLRPGERGFKIPYTADLDPEKGSFAIPLLRMFPGVTQDQLLAPTSSYDEETQALTITFEFKPELEKEPLEIICYYEGEEGDRSKQTLAGIKCGPIEYSRDEIIELYARLKEFAGGVRLESLSDEQKKLFEEAGVRTEEKVFTGEEISRVIERVFLLESDDEKRAALAALVPLLDKLPSEELARVICRDAEFGELEDLGQETVRAPIPTDDSLRYYLRETGVDYDISRISIGEFCKALEHFFKEEKHDPRGVDAFFSLIWTRTPEELREIIHYYNQTHPEEDFFSALRSAKFAPQGMEDENDRLLGEALSRIISGYQEGMEEKAPVQEEMIQLPPERAVTREGRILLMIVDAETDRGYVSLDDVCKALNWAVSTDREVSKEALDGFFSLINGRSPEEMARIRDRYEDKYGRTLASAVEAARWSGKDDEPKRHALERIQHGYDPARLARALRRGAKGGDTWEGTFEYTIERVFYGLSRAEARSVFHEYRERYGEDLMEMLDWELSAAEIRPIARWVMSYNLNATLDYLWGGMGGPGTSPDSVANVLEHAELSPRDIRYLIDHYPNHHENDDHITLEEHIVHDFMMKEEERYLDILERIKEITGD